MAGTGYKESLYVNQGDIPGWEKTGCGIACITMAIRQAAVRVNGRFLDSPKDLIDLCPNPKGVGEEMRRINGYVEGVGCKHASIARLLGNWGIPAYPQEFTSPDKNAEFKDCGMRKIIESCRRGGMVIASVYRNFSPRKGSGSHLILVTGARASNFLVSDPDYLLEKENGGKREVEWEEFAEGWRGYAVFVEIGQGSNLRAFAEILRKAGGKCRYRDLPDTW